MGATFQKLTRGAAVIAAIAVVAALAAAPALATARVTNGASIVATSLGSPDARSALQPRIFLQYAHSADTSSAAVASSPQTFLTYGHSADPSSATVSTPAPTFLSTRHAPDTNDPRLAAPVEIVTVGSPDSFDWGDFGIGIGASTAAMLLLGAAFMSTRLAQHRLRNA